GFALGINMIAGMAGSFLGIVVGGVLASVNWRWIFLINVPIGIIGSIWGFWQLREIGERRRSPISRSCQKPQIDPMMPIGTLIRKIQRQFTLASTPPTTMPRNDPAMPAIMLIPSAKP